LTERLLGDESDDERCLTIIFKRTTPSFTEQIEIPRLYESHTAALKLEQHGSGGVPAGSLTDSPPGLDILSLFVAFRTKGAGEGNRWRSEEYPISPLCYRLAPLPSQ
jgi:hypothetical protein